MERFHTTITERGSFRDCRRRWSLEVRERLSHKSQVAWALIFGECIHAALEAYYKKNERSLAKALSAFKRAWRKEDAILQESYGGLYKGSIEDEWLTYLEKGVTMLTYYKQYDDQADFDFESVIAVNIEARAFVDILNPHDESRLEGLPLLSGRIDLVVERKDGIWIWDHKTAASAYDARALDIDDQLTGYCYIYWRLTGDMPRGAVYNALIKSPPGPPKILKAGNLSQDKAQRTTYDLYLQAIKDNGLDKSEYEEILAYLKDKKWAQFYLREGVTMNEEQLLSFEHRLYYEYLDMQKVIAEPEWAYPNPSQRTCGWCSVLPICQAMEERGDPDFIKENMFIEQPVRAAVPKTILSPKWEGV